MVFIQWTPTVSLSVAITETKSPQSVLILVQSVVKGREDGFLCVLKSFEP